MSHNERVQRCCRAWIAGLVAGATLLQVATADPEGCVDCHGKFNPTLVAAWQESRHAAKGVGCAACHGDNHSSIFVTKGEVSAAVCGTCHAKQVSEFNSSLHAVAAEMMKADPGFSRLSPAMAELGCTRCHQIGTDFADGSRGKCNSCHGGHKFSVAEARRPEACAQCHSGPDHPQFEAWQTSKHGALYAAQSTRALAPTCVTCHMPQGTHDTGVGLSFGTVANGAVLKTSKATIKMRSMSAQEAERQRGLMVQVCLPCHSSRFATESLGKADLVKQESDALLEKAAGVIASLRKEGLLRGTSPLRGPETRGTEETTGEPQLLLSASVDYAELSPIEQRLLEMGKFHHAATFKGAYHDSPMYVHNLGFLRMKQDLEVINQQANQIRAISRDSNSSTTLNP